MRYPHGHAYPGPGDGEHRRVDIVFRLEKAFTTDPTKPFKIPRGELFPEDLESLKNDPNMVQDGKITTAGMIELKKRMPYADFADFEKDPQADKANVLLTVDAVVNYVQAKLNAT